MRGLLFHKGQQEEAAQIEERISKRCGERGVGVLVNVLVGVIDLSALLVALRLLYRPLFG